MTSSRKKHQHDNWLVDVKDGCFHKNVKFTSAAVYEINKTLSIQTNIDFLILMT